MSTVKRVLPIPPATYVVELTEREAYLLFVLLNRRVAAHALEALSLSMLRMQLDELIPQSVREVTVIPGLSGTVKFDGHFS